MLNEPNVAKGSSPKKEVNILKQSLSGTASPYSQSLGQ